jgi:hypothetical protein
VHQEDDRDEYMHQEDDRDEYKLNDNTPWGIWHPDKRPVRDQNMRVKWTDEEVQYIRDWLSHHYESPVRLLYDVIHQCTEARKIFHEHHTSLDRLSYMYKKLHE